MHKQYPWVAVFCSLLLGFVGSSLVTDEKNILPFDCKEKESFLETGKGEKMSPPTGWLNRDMLSL